MERASFTEWFLVKHAYFHRVATSRQKIQLMGAKICWCQDFYCADRRWRYIDFTWRHNSRYRIFSTYLDSLTSNCCKNLYASTISFGHLLQMPTYNCHITYNTECLSDKRILSNKDENRCNCTLVSLLFNFGFLGFLTPTISTMQNLTAG